MRSTDVVTDRLHAAAKAITLALDVLKDAESAIEEARDPATPVSERAHKASDHAGQGTRSCPHCGKVLAQLAEKADQGAPAHKCMASALDVLKAAAKNRVTSVDRAVG